MSDIEVREKDYDPKVENRAVQDLIDVNERLRPSGGPIIFHIAQRAQTITPWGVDPAQRDRELRSFWLAESWLASVVYSVSIRNASFAWEIVGADASKETPKNTARAVERMLKNSQRGKGWKSFITKTCIDMYTQDNGAVWNLVRAANRPDAPIINIIQLDSARCWRTGDYEYPIIYMDRKGRERVMRWWEVKTIEEFPSPIETAFDLQICAVSRCLLAAEIVQSLSTYKLEKISGNFTRAVDFVSGVTQQNIDDALALAREQILNKGLLRFSLPLLIPGIDPNSALSHVHIDLASLPDNFSEDESFKWYVAQLAAAFGVDYQEIAPLMSGNLGSGMQGEIMHLKTRGKGPALIMGLFEDIINDGLIPRNVKFRFLEQDLRTETEKAEARFTRSKDRSMRVKMGELDGKAARRIAVADGDLPEWLADEIDKREETMPQPMSVPEQGRQEMTANQISGGIETQETKALTLESVEELRKAVSEDPLNFLSKRIQKKISYGVPEGTVIAPVYLTKDLIGIQHALAKSWKSKDVRLTPENQFHITLAHGQRVDEIDFALAHKTIEHSINDYLPQTINVNKIGYFESAGSKVVVGLVEKTPRLVELQEKLYIAFSELNVPMSDFSLPDKWTPHVTLAYVPMETVLTETAIAPINLVIDTLEFTRSDYRMEHSSHGDWS